MDDLKDIPHSRSLFVSRPIRCSLCTKKESNPDDLLNHIRSVHQNSDEFTCALCNQSFDQIWKLGRHLPKCSQKNVDKKVQNVFLRTTKEGFEKYRELSHEAGFDFALKLAKNMNVPRNAIFEVIQEVKNLLKSVGGNIQNLVIPLLKENKMHEFENVIFMINECFKKVDTEHNLDQFLSEKQLISPLKKIPVEDNQTIDASEDDTSESETDIATDDCTEDENDSDDDDDNVPNGLKSKTATLMDVRFQIKSFFELPDVFRKMQSNADNIRKSKYLNHFINGKVWQRKLQHFEKDEIVIPYHLHIDDTQTNNCLGSHLTNGDQTCVYYSFPTIPNEYIARLDTIFTALLFESKLSKDFGNEKCYERLVEDLNKLADDGIIMNFNGEEQKVFFVMGLLLGDNKGVNNCLGFAKGFRANYYCRFCRLRREEMERSYKENINDLRNKENYEEDLLIGNGTLTGIFENSPFNKIRYFHATDSCADVMHDVNEGILRYNICEIILYFLKKKYFTLSMLNEEKCKKDYGEIEENNKSCHITRKSLKARKLKMTASESYSFAHHLPFILLNIIKEERREQLQNDEVWQFLITTIRFLDMCYMTSYDRSSINTLRRVVATMNEMYVRLFNKTLKPKHHFATHYPTLIKKFGPLRFMSSMRYEAKHRFVKNYTKNTISRKNISYSLGRKLQYNFAYFLKSQLAFKDRFEVFKPKLVKIIDEDFFPFIKPSTELDSMSEQLLYVCDKVKLNGITLSSQLYLPYINGNQLQLLKIVKLLMVSKDDASSIKIIYQKYAEVKYCSIYASYVVKNLLPEMSLMNMQDVVFQRIYPVALHDTIGLKMFRYKTF